MAERRHFLFRARRCAGHVHVAVWAGTAVEKTTGGRPNLGELRMTEADWIEMQSMLLTGHQGQLTIENAIRPGACNCGHGPGYHDGRRGPARTAGDPDQIDPPVGRCHFDGCRCLAYITEGT